MVVGIDVGSKHLDLAVTAAAPELPRRLPTTTQGLAQLIPILMALQPTLIVLEATGTSHQPLLTALLLARFAELHHSEWRRAEPEAADLARLRQLVGSRDDLVAHQTAVRNRQHAAGWAGDAAILGWLDADLAQLETRLQQVAREIAAVLVRLPETAVLTAQIGVGIMTAAAVLASLPAGVLGHPKAATASAGVPPRQAQSGQRAHSRLSQQGCPALRRSLSLAAMSAIRFDPELAAWYQALCARGKAKQRALCAVAHTLVRRMMGRLRQARAERAAQDAGQAMACAA